MKWWINLRIALLRVKQANCLDLRREAIESGDLDASMTHAKKEIELIRRITELENK